MTNKDINVPINDCISRQAAINAICEDGTRLERNGRYRMTMVERKQRDVDILENLPSAQPERNKGEWIPIMRSDVLDGYLCSVCGRWSGFKYKFCGNCGADMRRDNI